MTPREIDAELERLEHAYGLDALRAAWTRRFNPGRKGRPSIDDDPWLHQMADLMVQDPSLRRFGAATIVAQEIFRQRPSGSVDTIARRLDDKFTQDSDFFLDAADHRIQRDRKDNILARYRAFCDTRRPSITASSLPVQFCFSLITAGASTEHALVAYRYACEQDEYRNATLLPRPAPGFDASSLYDDPLSGGLSKSTRLNMLLALLQDVRKPLELASTSAGLDPNKLMDQLMKDFGKRPGFKLNAR